MNQEESAQALGPRRAYVYVEADGLFTGVVLSGGDELIEANLAAGEGAYFTHEVFDPGCHKMAGDRQAIEPWVPPAPGPHHEWDEPLRRWRYVKQAADYAAEVRAERDRLMAGTDWLVTRANETGEPMPQRWLDYRQALRDVTSQPGFPMAIDWPPVPAEDAEEVPSPEEQARNLEVAIDRELDRIAQSRGYRDIVSACSYTGGSPEHRFTIESRAFSLWRQDVWDTAYAVLAEVQAGLRSMPTIEEAIALMPVLPADISTREGI